jgi:uncharacterized protein
MDYMNTYAPFARPLYVMAKTTGAACNLSCKYCYYLEKKNLYKDHETTSRFDMTDALLEKFIDQYINSQTQPEIMFTWHGGEPLMRPLSFYEHAVQYQQKYARRSIISNCIQTNGTLINEDWCRFFKDNNWLVGVSIDGPQRFHDAYRRSRDGQPSFARVMHGIELLNRYDVQWNAMSVVNNLNVEHPLEFYRFFKGIQCHFIQFTPIVERIVHHDDGRYLACPSDNGEFHIADFSITPEKWGDFLCTIFKEWVRKDVGSYYIQLFDSTLANWIGEKPGVCTMAPTCGHAGVMEYNGDVYTCDHFVFPEYKLGNIYTNTLMEMMYSEKETAFGNAKRDTLPRQCNRCDYLFACNGECPKNRFAFTNDGEPGLNYLCKGYYKFFDYVAPYMDFMKKELLAKRAPANVMNWIKNNYRR